MAPQHQLMRSVKDETAAYSSRAEQAQSHAPQIIPQFQLSDDLCMHIHIHGS